MEDSPSLKKGKPAALAATHPHRPYASMNWIRFNGSLRRNSREGRTQQYLSPLSGPPW
ncbi:hypothetical protein GCM10017653_36170 [Ancylobacter defluvii]|uniref:Uncharacterized protein n=1 Tax=Ancylobacter defluvii TaxID=1282440 RepID=A0A9W6JYL9_9HYPH|nr:hypothetical protein GCM10017653_36170 [Ancylobacter defluvii]